MSAPSTVQWLRTAVTRIAVGSGRRATYLAAWTIHRARRVWARATGWLSDGVGLGWILRAAALLAVAALLRKIAIGLAAGIYHRVEDGGAPWLMWGAAACWIVSAYRAGAEGWEPKRPAMPVATDAEGPADGGQEQAAPTAGQPSAPRPVSPTALVGAVRDVGTPHAQLKPLAEHLGVSTDAVRAAAAGVGWPVKDVRMEGRSSSAGLRWDDCPSPTILAPSSGVVGAGQAADDNDDDASGEGAEKGLRVTVIGQGGKVVHDLAETIRRHTVRGS